MDKPNFKEIWKWGIIAILSLVIGVAVSDLMQLSIGLRYFSIFVFGVVFFLSLGFVQLAWVVFYKIKNNRKSKEKPEKPRIPVIAIRAMPEISDDGTIEKLQIINQSDEKLLNCIISIYGFHKETPSGISGRDIKSNQISWSKSERKTANNKVDLIKNIPVKADIFKATPDKRIFLIGEGDNNTPITEGGSYKVELQLDGDNLDSHVFYIRFECYLSNRIEITKVSNFSLPDSRLSTVEIPHKLKIDVDAFNKKLNAFLRRMKIKN
jgi:hypothetical protein